MAENPIKLFSSRAERYPQPDDADVALGAGRAALAAIPVIGGTLTEVLSLVLAPAVARRRDTWFKELAAALEEAERKIEGFSVESLTQNEEFVSAVIEASRIALSTHQHEKRVLLRNALISVAAGRAPSEDLQHVFLNAIADFTPAHIKVLNVLWRGTQKAAAIGLWNPITNTSEVRDYTQAIGRLYPELNGQQDLIQHIITDLFNRRLSCINDSQAPFPDGTGVTNLGIHFLQFVLSEEEFQK